MQNGCMESVNGKMRDECLNEHLFASLGEARRIIETWRIDYNEVRPHSSLGYQTPDEFAAAWQEAGELVIGGKMGRRLTGFGLPLHAADNRRRYRALDEPRQRAPDEARACHREISAIGASTSLVLRRCCGSAALTDGVFRQSGTLRRARES